MNKQVSYNNTVYNNELTNERQELKEINNKLTAYFNSNSRNSPMYEIHSARNVNNNPIYSSVKSLEKDLEKLKHLYDEELRMMRLEIEELSTVKNKYSLENFNLEIKLQDFIEKFEEIKRSNQSLANELNEVKVKNNRLEYDLQTFKIETENPVRENKQLKKDLDDLLNKLNEKQAISDSEISYRQELELKYKELLDEAKFEKKLFDQESQKLKDQLESTNQTIKHLEIKFSESIRKEIEKNEILMKRLTELQLENESIKYEKKQSEEQLDSMRSMICNFENVISNLETMKKVVEGRMNKNNETGDLEYANADQSLMNTIKEIRKKIQNEESRLKLVPVSQRLKPDSSHSNESVRKHSIIVNSGGLNDEEVDQTAQEELDKLLGNTSHRSTNSSTPPLKQSKIEQIKQHTPIGPILSNKRAQSAQVKHSSTFVKHFEHRKSPLRSNSQLEIHRESPSNLLKDEAFFPSPPNTPETNPRTNPVKLPKETPTIVPGKDYTADLFNTFEKATFLTDTKSDEIIKSNLDTQQQQSPVVEASFTGNVKIHEVNKNGYYVRLLNISNTVDEDLSYFTIQQIVSGMPVAVFRFPKSVKLAPGNTVTVWSRTDEVTQQLPQTFVWNEQDKWGTGPECTTILAKPNGQAVSWTTGCHKYGNVDYDDIVTVYNHKRTKTPSVQLNRKKLTPQTIFSPTKHPHASSSRIDSYEQQQERTNSTINRIITAPKSRFSNSASTTRKSQISMNEYRNNFGDINADEMNMENNKKENFNYFSKTKLHKDQTLFKNKIN